MPAIAPAIVEKCFLEYTGPLRFISCTRQASRDRTIHMRLITNKARAKIDVC